MRKQVELRCKEEWEFDLLVYFYSKKWSVDSYPQWKIVEKSSQCYLGFDREARKVIYIEYTGVSIVYDK